MKKLNLFLFALLCTSTGLEAGVLSMTNQIAGSAGDTAIVDTSNIVLVTGIAASGYFTSGYDVDAGLANAISTGNFTTFLSNYNTLVSDQIGASGGSGFAGYYYGAVDYGTPLTNPYVGAALYTILGNGATLAASLQLGILRSSDIVNSDTPTPDSNSVLLGRNGNTSLGNVTILMGSIGTNVMANSGGGLASTASFKLQAIPEPSTLLLASLGVFGLLRRRR